MSAVRSSPVSLQNSAADAQVFTDETFPFTFLDIIDADHLAINRLAGKIRKVLASEDVYSRLSELNSLLLEVAWRLVRHDFSEDIVMRPAFASVLGDRGVEMVERDRADHASGREVILAILRELDLTTGEDIKERRQERLANVAEMVTAAFDELGEHMKVESGEVLPHFESVISADLSAKLARQYADTLLMTPSLTRRTTETEGQLREAVFPGGIDQYIRTPLAELKQSYRSILDDSKSRAGKIWFDEATDQELEKIQIDRQQKRDIIGRPDEFKGSGKELGKKKSKEPTNALGLPVSWHKPRNGKL